MKRWRPVIATIRRHQRGLDDGSTARGRDTRFPRDVGREFDSADGTRIARLYHAPCVTMRGDGSIHFFQSQEDLTRFFQGVADSYRKDDYRTGRFRNLEVVPIGARSALVTVDWELLRADESVIREWRQSYNLVRAESGRQILVSTLHLA